MRDTVPFTETKCGGWWRTANLGECPITLECFSSLGYPPFALYHPGKTTPTQTTPTTTTITTADDHANRDGVSAYFDGLALASYIVSRGVFQNPLTRIELNAEDCRRLDRYLEDHCCHSSDCDATTATRIFRGSRKISVAEAFALRNSMSVETTTIRSDGRQYNSNNNNNINSNINERNRERIQALQNAATAALAGLFVYGNDRRRFHTHEITPHVPRWRTETPFPRNDWGFDLSRRLEDASAQDMHGYTVIDDDEAVAVASRRYAYESVQEAFPPLTESAPRNPRGPESSDVPLVSSEERLMVMERIRTLSVRDEDEQKKHALKLENAREQISRHALERRQQKQKDRANRLVRDSERYASQKKDEAELERARMEIEAWRDQQWEILRLLSEQGQHASTKRQSKVVESGEPKIDSDQDGGRSDKAEAETVVDGETIRDAMAEETKKAKASAKRKRAKERKKAQKMLEKKEAETIRLRQTKEAQQAASGLKCGACGTGILKPSLAFERFDQRFCSPKCARTAVKLIPG